MFFYSYIRTYKGVRVSLLWISIEDEEPSNEKL